MSRNKSVFDDIIQEVAEEFSDEELTYEELREFWKFYWKNLKHTIGFPKYPMVIIPKLGTLKPIPSRIKDDINKLRDDLEGERVFVKEETVKNKLEILEVLMNNINRIKKEVKSYGKRTG